MKFVVCVKQTYDIAANFTIDAGHLRWAGDADPVINPWDEFSVEAALLQAESVSGEVIALSVGPNNARDALKHALAMGCDSAIWVQTGQEQSFDSQALAAILTAAIRKIGDVDAVFFGKQASDSEMGVMAVQTARSLKWPALTLVSAITKIDAGQKTLSAERSMDEGRQAVQVKLPVVISINKDFAEPRFPSFLGTRKAAKAVIPAWTLSDLAVSAVSNVVDDQGALLLSQQKGQLEIITGATPDEIAAGLVERILNEQVL